MFKGLILSCWTIFLDRGKERGGERRSFRAWLNGIIWVLSSMHASFCHSSNLWSFNDVFHKWGHCVSVFGHGIEVATKLKGSTSHDQLLIQTSESFSGLLLFAIGFLLFMVAFVKDREFQIFFAKGCTSLHVSVAFWRVYFEQKLEDLAHDLPRLVVGDIALALSWVFFLVYSWREKYD